MPRHPSPVVPRAPARLALLALVALGGLAASCPAARYADRDVPADAERARVPLEGTTAMLDGALRVTFVSMERAGSFANVTLTLEGGGGSVTDEVTAVRQADASDPVRLPPWSVAVVGFPGVDSVVVAAWRSGE